MRRGPTINVPIRRVWITEGEEFYNIGDMTTLVVSLLTNCCNMTNFETYLANKFRLYKVGVFGSGVGASTLSTIIPIAFRLSQ